MLSELNDCLPARVGAENAAEDRKSAFAFTAKDMRFFYSIAGVLVVAIIILVIAIIRR